MFMGLVESTISSPKMGELPVACTCGIRGKMRKLYTDDWKRFIVEKYGSETSVQYFATPVIVDNLTGEIITNE